MNSKLYRSSKIGECLRESLFELIEAGKITEEVAQKVLCQFDKSTHHAFDTRVSAKATLRGDLKTYRYLDNVWQFSLGDVTLKLPTGRSSESGEVQMSSAELVCMDSKLIQKDKDEWEGHERLQAAMTDAISVKKEPGIGFKKEESL